MHKREITTILGHKLYSNLIPSSEFDYINASLTCSQFEHLLSFERGHAIDLKEAVWSYAGLVVCAGVMPPLDEFGKNE